MKRYSWILIIIPAIVLMTEFSGCTVVKQNALEGDNLLGIICEGIIKNELNSLVKNALERPIYTPQPEPRFDLVFAEDDSLLKMSKWQNVLLMGTLDSDDPVSLRIKKMLKGQVLEGVEKGEYQVFKKKDVWVNRQTVVFLISRNKDELAKWLVDNSYELYSYFADDRRERQEKQIYALMEQKSLSDSLEEAHGWNIRLQHDYTVVASERSPDFVRLRRRLPDRFITIAWKIGEPEDVTLENLVQWRDNIGLKFADPVKLNTKHLSGSEYKIADLKAIKAYGIWSTLGPLGGGPCVSYMLYHSGTLYLLDGQVFAPDRKKEPFIRQLEIILETFKPTLG